MNASAPCSTNGSSFSRPRPITRTVLPSARSRSAAVLPVCPVAPGTTIMMFASASSPRGLLSLRLEHGNLDARFAGEVDRFGVTRVGVSRDADAGIVGEHPLDALGHFFRAIGDDHLAVIRRVADADASTVVDRAPARATRGV